MFDILRRILGSGQRNRKPHIPPLFQTQSWAMKIPENWTPNEDGNTVMFVPGEGDDAALFVSAYFKDSEISLSEMRDAIEGQTHNNSPVSEVQVGDFRGFYTSFTRSENDGDCDWRIWCLCSSNVHLYITYNCSVGRRSVDNTAIDEMLKTLLHISSE